MHRARKPQLQRIKKLVSGLLTAVVLTGALVVARPVSWTPICATFEEGSWEWFLFFCYIDPPPKEPRT